MPDTILVVVEQRDGKLNRVSWETISAGQAVAAATGWNLEAAVVGASASSIAAEVAAKKVAKVYAVESAKLEPYTPDAFAVALKQSVGFQFAEVVTKLIESVAVGGEAEGSEESGVDVFGAQAAHCCTSVQEDLHQADDAGVMNPDPG